MAETKTPRKKSIAYVKKHMFRATVTVCLMAVIVYWYRTDQMMLSAALPSMCTCSMCLGFHIGEYTKERERVGWWQEA